VRIPSRWRDQPDTSPEDLLVAWRPTRGVGGNIQHTGDDVYGLGVKAHDVLTQQMAQEAAVAAFQDCFLLTAIVFILAMVPALFIRPQRRQVWRKRV
jgi:hypothetical protein